MQTSDLKTFSNGVTIQESIYKDAAPALAVFKDVLYIAWPDSDYKLNVGQYSNGQIVIKSTLNEKTVATPGLTADEDYLYIAWTGTNEGSDLLNQDTDNNLNVMRSSDGTNFGSNSDLGSAATYDETVGPGLTMYDGKLFIGWTAASIYALHLADSTDQGLIFGGETVDKDNASNYGLALCSNLVAWTGTDYKVNLQDGI